jgi:hypothetical protein
VVELLPSMCEAYGSVPYPIYKKVKKIIVHINYIYNFKLFFVLCRSPLVSNCPVCYELILALYLNTGYLTFQEKFFLETGSHFAMYVAKANFELEVSILHFLSS